MSLSRKNTQGREELSVGYESNRGTRELLIKSFDKRQAELSRESGASNTSIGSEKA